MTRVSSRDRHQKTPCIRRTTSYGGQPPWIDLSRRVGVGFPAPTEGVVCTACREPPSLSASRLRKHAWLRWSGIAGIVGYLIGDVCSSAGWSRIVVPRRTGGAEFGGELMLPRRPSSISRGGVNSNGADRSNGTACDGVTQLFQEYGVARRCRRIERDPSSAISADAGGSDRLFERRIAPDTASQHLEHGIRDHAHNMCATVVLKNDVPVFALGGAGFRGEPVNTRPFMRLRRSTSCETRPRHPATLRLNRERATGGKPCCSSIRQTTACSSVGSPQRGEGVHLGGVRWTRTRV